MHGAVPVSYTHLDVYKRQPHDFVVRLSLGHRGHVHDYDLEFCEHEHTHDHTELEGLDINSAEYRDCLLYTSRCV